MKWCSSSRSNRTLFHLTTRSQQTNLLFANHQINQSRWISSIQNGPPIGFPQPLHQQSPLLIQSRIARYCTRFNVQITNDNSSISPFPIQKPSSLLISEIHRNILQILSQEIEGSEDLQQKKHQLIQYFTTAIESHQTHSSQFSSNEEFYKTFFEFCTTLKSLELANLAHQQWSLHFSVPENKTPPETLHLLEILLNMLIHCESVLGAISVWKQLYRRDPSTLKLETWSSVMALTLRHGEISQARLLYSMMQRGGLSLDGNQFAEQFSACRIAHSTLAYEFGTHLHQSWKITQAKLARNSSKVPSEQRNHSELNVLLSLTRMYTAYEDISRASKVISLIHPLESNFLEFPHFLGELEQITENLMELLTRKGTESSLGKLCKASFSWGFRPSNELFAKLFCACEKLGTVKLGMMIRDHLAQSLSAESSEADSRGSTVQIFRAMIRMFSQGKSLSDVESTLEEMRKKHYPFDQKTWKVVIGAYLNLGQLSRCLELFQESIDLHTIPSDSYWVNLINQCTKTNHQLGMRVYRLWENIPNGTQFGYPVWKAFFRLFEQMANAKEINLLFDKIQETDLKLEPGIFNTLLRINLEANKITQSQILISKMLNEKVRPGTGNLIKFFTLCGNRRSLGFGKRIHKLLEESGLEQENVRMATAIINMYSKCGNINDADQVFQELLHQGLDLDLITWSTIILAHLKVGNAEKASKLLKAMRDEGLSLDSKMYPTMIILCSDLKIPEFGREIHRLWVESNPRKDISRVAGALRLMYTKCKLSPEPDLEPSIRLANGEPWVLPSSEQNAESVKTTE